MAPALKAEANLNGRRFSSDDAVEAAVRMISAGRQRFVFLQGFVFCLRNGGSASNSRKTLLRTNESEQLYVCAEYISNVL